MGRDGGGEKGETDATVGDDILIAEEHGEAINASGHVQELERNFGLLSICSVGIVTGNSWCALGGSIVVALYNGGPPGIIYEFIAVCIFYFLVAACVAELASAIPSSAGGMAYSIGTPDCVSHLAEEIPNPKTNIPKAIAAQMIIGFVTGFSYLVAILYSINSFDDVLQNNFTFPLAEIYYQATSSRGGALGLILVIFFCTVITCVGTYITSGRMLWTLARDGATPFSKSLARVSRTWKNPFRATLVCGIACTVLGCIYIGSTTAFNAFVGSFVVLSTLSYLAAILPHLLTRRVNVKPGPFWMPTSLGMAILCISSAYIVVWNTIYFFPYVQPVTAKNMNYSVVITGGLTIVALCWWLIKSVHGYQGPSIRNVGGET
ncbi:MAG: hypothetical protein M1820_005806 [Bogoriella megaspora]|nr:MAG: hypothetical protein M1820_005806 [Bogoriella megaspora]